MRTRRFAGFVATCAVIASTGCGTKATPYTAPPKQAEGLTGCGGGLSIGPAGEAPKEGSLVTKGTVASVDRGEHALAIGLDGGQSFAMSATKDLEAPLKVGDVVDVSIECSVVGWNATDCTGTVSREGALVAFDHGISGWTIVRGPLLERDPHPNYGPTEKFALVVTHAGATATTPLRGCSELRTAQGTFRVSGVEIEHRPPRAPDSADYRHFSVVRVP
ncbi:MAG TPA: hypothetical protein VIV11_00380 [Kofleriaceae bacterium]